MFAPVDGSFDKTVCGRKKRSLKPHEHVNTYVNEHALNILGDDSPSSFLSLFLFEVVFPTSLNTLLPLSFSYFLPSEQGWSEKRVRARPRVIIIFPQIYIRVDSRFNSLTFISYQGRFYRDTDMKQFISEVIEERFIMKYNYILRAKFEQTQFIMRHH